MKMPAPDDEAPDAHSTLRATSIPIIVTNAPQFDNPIVFANTAFTNLTGYTERELIGRNCRLLQGVDTNPQVVADIRTALAQGLAIRREILNYRKDGTTFWNDLRIDPIHDSAGILTGFVSIQSDSSAVHLAVEAKQQAETRLGSIAGHIPGYIYQRVLRTDGKIEVLYCSPSINKLLGMPDADISGTFYSHVHPDDLAALTVAVRKSAAEMSTFREEFRLISADGAAHWMRSDAPPRLLPGGDIVWEGLAIEISAEKRWESEIADLALRDPLTGLLTREAWRRALAMQLANSDDAGQCAIFYADVDAFRDLNDSLGQRLCDDILRRIAQRLSTAAASVAGVAGRLGGDEFAILVPAVSGESAASEFAAALVLALGRPFEVSAQLLTIPTSVGASVHTELDPARLVDGDAASELMTQAELALRWAKQAGPGGHAVYSAEQDDRFKDQVVLERSLERAIAADELELHYQPIVELASGRIISAEALVRWNHPTLGMQRAQTFSSPRPKSPA